MKRPSPLWLIPVAAALLLFVPAVASAQTPNASTSVPADGTGGAVFTMTNAVTGNHVLASRIGNEGALIPAGSFATHGSGTGASLADAGSVILTDDHHFLLVVNAGSDSVTVFSVSTASSGPVLTYVGPTTSHGPVPVSIAVHGPTVYVLNAGDASRPGDIAGFQLSSAGRLSFVTGSRQPLSTRAPIGPAQISFDPSGAVLVVTEKGTNLIDTYSVVGGVARAPTFTASNGTTPYGFAWGKGGVLIVSDAASDALTSYTVSSTGALTVVSGSVADGQTAACWVAVAHGGTIAYTTNADSSTISTYAVGSGGTLSLTTAVAATTGATDTDMAVAGSHGQYLIVLDAGAAEIQEFGIGGTGGLTPLYGVFSLPATAEGMAAF
ncbi:MAG: lactonase family protein [Thermoplasmata archaeon]